MTTKIVRGSVRSIALAIARSRGITLPEAQKLADHARRERAAAEPGQHLASVAAILASELKIPLEQARIQAVHAGFGPHVEAPRPSVRAVAKVLADRGVPIVVAQERAERIVAASDARRAVGASGVRPAAPTHAGALPFVHMSLRRLALEIVKRQGVSFEQAMQMADAQRRGQTPRQTVRALAKTFEQQGYKPADALRAAEKQLGRSLAEDEGELEQEQKISRDQRRNGGSR